MIYEAYFMGEQAFLDGYPFKDNPFDPLDQPVLFGSWDEGWLDAKCEE
jgi:hypothetical protein